MDENLFFKPTPLYKEFMILDYIHKNKNITQRAISEQLNIAVSMVNKYLDNYSELNYLIKDYKSSKQIHYNLTKKGEEKMEYLNISYLEASQTIYLSAKENIVSFLKKIYSLGFKKIYLYGAGEVSEIMLQVIYSEKSIPIEVVGVIDDDTSKVNSTIVGIPIFLLDKINHFSHDGILISSYTHSHKIYHKLLDMDYDEKKILKFFIN